MQTLGYNYRLTDIQAALGLSQLNPAEQGLEARRAIAARYDDAFRNHEHIRVQAADLPSREGHAYHLYVILADRRRELYEFLRAQGIFCQVHYIPVHLMPYYRGLGTRPGDFPVAEHYYTECLSLPMYPSLTKSDQEYVIEKTLAFYKAQ